MKLIIWTSSLDLSTGGVDKFCRENADKYGKTEQDLRALSLLDLASRYMWNERRHRFLEVKEKLSTPTQAPVLVIADKADFGNHSHKECSILSGERLSQILDSREGLSTTFYSDGKDIRCEDITENGTNFYLFREVTHLNGLGAFTAAVERGEPFTQSQLDQYTRSLAPQVHQLLGWPIEEHRSLEVQIQQARDRQTQINVKEKITVPLER